MFSQTRVSGVVIDDLNEPVSFANIVFKGSNIGVSADIDGKFELSSTANFKAIFVSSVGYSKREIQLLSSENLNSKIVLKANQELNEVVVLKKPKKHLSKKENPAYKILLGIWENKLKNGLSLLKSYDYKKYTSVAIGLSNLDSLFLKKTLNKQYDSIIPLIEYDTNRKNYHVPIFLNETVESVYGNPGIGKEKTDLEAERRTGIGKEGFFFTRIQNTFSTIDIYKDNIEILNKSFKSPISRSGYSSYEYVLKDSLVEGNKKTYTLYFFPRQEGDLVFEGHLKVVNNTFALTEISMKVNRKINLNLVRDLFIEKQFEQVNDSLYLPSKDYYEGDFTLFTKDDFEKGFFVKKNIFYTDYDLETKHKSGFYDQIISQTKADQFLKNEAYWKGITVKEAGLNDTRKVISHLNANSRIQGVSNALDLISTGYFDLFNKVQFGSFWQSIATNDIEGLRVKLGFRTFKTINDLFRATWYGAYGNKDKNFKYGVEFRYLVSQKPRIILGISNIYDDIQLGGNTLSTNDLLSSWSNSSLVISRGENYFLSNVFKNTFNTDIALHPNLHVLVSGVHQITKSADMDHFSIAYLSPDSGTIKNELTDFSTILAMVYSPRRLVYGFGVNQRFGVSYFPTFTVKFTHGFKNVLGGDFNYNKLQMSFNKPIFLSTFGLLKTFIEMGKSFETLPLPLLNPIVSNQAYSVIPNTFALLDYYDMVTDTYVVGHFEHHFNGFIFNRIPLLKRINFRELIFYRGAYGTISEANIAMNKSNILYEAPKDKIYSEYGFGIENIGYGNFRPFRFDCIWRNEFKNVNGLASPKFGVRVAMILEF